MTHAPTSGDLHLAHGLTFPDLFDRAGLMRMDGLFLEHLHAADTALADTLLAARSDLSALSAREQSDLLVAVAPHLEDFIAELFGVRAEVGALAARHHELAPLYSVKRLFVQRRAMTRIKPEAAAQIDG